MKWKIGNTTVDVLPPVKQYMNAIERRLRMDRATRVRIMTELAGDFESRREAGQSDEQIMAELGTPEEVAAQFNTALGAPQKPSRWRWAFVAVAAVVLALGAGSLVADALAAREVASLGIIGGADGPPAIYVTAGPAAWFPPLVLLPWLRGCAAGFWLPTWRNPRACKGYGPSLLLSGLGLLLFLAVVLPGASMAGFAPETPAGVLWHLLVALLLTGSWLCAVIFCRALWVRHRNRQARGQGKEKK